MVPADHRSSSSGSVWVVRSNSGSASSSNHGYDGANSWGTRSYTSSESRREPGSIVHRKETLGRDQYAHEREIESIEEIEEETEQLRKYNEVLGRGNEDIRRQTEALRAEGRHYSESFY
jgi:hypothetical protein